MTLTLIFPSVGRKEGTPYVRAWQMEPLSMAVLAGLTPPGVDLRFHDDRLEEIPFDDPTDLVALSVETFTALRAYRIAREFRARGVPVVLGGYHVTLMPEEAAREDDAIVVGDAEPVWAQVLDDARRGRLQPRYDGTARRTLAGVRPRRDVFAGKSYQRISLVESARGCQFKCDFCSVTAFHGARQDHRPAREVAAEMEAIGTGRFFIVDDNIVSQPARARELCRELIPLGVRWVGQASIHIARDEELLGLLARSGCLGLLIGMESLDPANLRDMGKGWNLAGGGYAESLRRFRDHGLAVYGTFVFGYDNDDRRAVQESVEFAREQKLFLAAFNHLIPFPGTPLYRRLEGEGRQLKPHWWLDPESRVGEVSFRPRKMEPGELEELCLDARRQFYGWGSIWERLRDPRANLSSPMMLGIYLGLNLGSHFDIDRRQGLRLGAGPAPVGARHERVLTSGRAGLPRYHEAGAYHTMAIPLTRFRRASRRVGLAVRPARPEDLPAVLDFLATTGPRRQFFPRLRADDFLEPEGSMRGLELDRLLLAERDGRLVGTLAGWDQHAYRQSVVHSYRGWLRLARPFYNAWSALARRPGLPAPGGSFRYLMAALPVAADDDVDAFAALLDALRGRAAGGPWSHLLVGLHEADPLRRVAQRYQAACYLTRLFLVCWADGEPARSALDGRAPYLEAGSL